MVKTYRTIQVPSGEEAAYAAWMHDLRSDAAQNLRIATDKLCNRTMTDVDVWHATQIAQALRKIVMGEPLDDDVYNAALMALDESRRA